MNVRFPLIVFDLDGTLIDSRRDLTSAVNDALRSYGAAPLRDEAVGAMVGDGAAVLVRRAFSAAAMTPPPAQAFDRFRSSYARRLLEHTVPYEGVPAMLAALREGRTLAVLTNKPAGFSRTILERLGLDRFFGSIVGGDEAWPRKPAPDALIHLMAEAHAAPVETLLVGDSIIDIQTARAAGAASCAARYGFGFDDRASSALTLSDLVIDAPAELTRYFLKGSS